jgi:hypothetical protein
LAGHDRVALLDQDFGDDAAFQMLDFLLGLLGNDAPGSTGYLVDLYDDGKYQREKGGNSKNDDEPPLRFGGDPVDAARKSRRFLDLRCDLAGGAVALVML